VGQRNRVLDGVADPHGKGVVLRQEGATHCKVYGRSAVSCAKTAEPIEMPFGSLARMGPKNHVLGEYPDPPWEGAIFRGKGRPVVKYREALP